MNLVSIIIPYAPYHTSIVEQAIAAARSQSLKCDVIPIPDLDGQGGALIFPLAGDPKFGEVGVRCHSLWSFLKIPAAESRLVR